jgi:hypothetical protein
MPRQLCLATVLLLAATAPAPAQVRAFHHAAGGYSVAMQADWQAVPAEVVDQVLGNMAQVTGAALPPMAGFALNRQPGAPLRIMLIGAMHDPQLTEATLAKELVGPAAAASFERTLQQVNHTLPETVEMGSLSWDQREHIIWVDGGSQPADGPPVHLMLIYRPVEHWGTLMAVVLGESTTLAELRELMLPIIHSLAVDGRAAAP